MKARFTDKEGRVALLWGKPEEILTVVQGLKGKSYVPTTHITGSIKTDWATVFRVCRDGLAKRVYTVGETLMAKHSTFGSVVWRICRVEEDRMVLVATNPVCDMVFDECEKEQSEDGSPNPESCRKYGYNRWEESAIRQWLNSAEGAGKWWKPQNDWDVEPGCHGKVAGFMAGFDRAFLACVRESEITTASEDGNGSYTTRDRFYLPSITEVWGDTNNGVQEGEKLDLGKGFCRGRYWWLRSPNVGFADFVYNVHSSGAMHDHTAHNSFGVIPACVVGKL